MFVQARHIVIISKRNNKMNMLIYSVIFLLVKGILGNFHSALLDNLFKDQPVSLKFVTCWNKDIHRKILINNSKFDKPKQLAFNVNFGDVTFKDYLIIDLNCNNSRIFLNKMDHLDATQNSIRMLIFADKYHVMNFLKDLNIFQRKPSTNSIFIATKVGDGFDLLKIEETTSALKFYGSWNKKDGLTLSPPLPYRCNFFGKEFDINLIIRDNSTWQHLEDFRFRWIDIYTKQNYAILSRLFDYCNITPSYIAVPDYVHNSSFMLTGSSPYVTKHLLQKVDILYVQNGPKICVIMRKPPTSYVQTIFTGAFTTNVWWAMLGTVGLLAFVLYFILNIESGREKIKQQEKFGVLDLALIGLEAICQQGTWVDPKTYSARILQVIMFLAFMFLYVSYSTNILVLLQSTSKIHDFEKLKKFKVQYGGMDTSDMLQYSYVEGKNIFSIQGERTKFYSIPDGMLKVKEGLFAFFVESQYAYNFANENFTDYEICGLHEIGGYANKNLGYVSLPKQSPYKEIFKIVLLRMGEFGFQKRHYTRYFLKPRCFSNTGSFDPVGIAETYQIIYLVFLGIVSSLTILMMEYVVSKLQKIIGIWR